MAKEKTWCGTPESCDICSSPIKDTFIDGRTRMGPWGILCPACHSEVGAGLGLGLGQKYKRVEEEGNKVKWVKIAG